MYVRTYLPTYIHTYIHTYIRICTCTCTCTCICICICIYAHTQNGCSKGLAFYMPHRVRKTQQRSIFLVKITSPPPPALPLSMCWHVIPTSTSTLGCNHGILVLQGLRYKPQNLGYPFAISTHSYDSITRTIISTFWLYNNLSLKKDKKH